MLLQQIEQTGIHLNLQGGQLVYRCAKGAMTPELKSELQAHKDELVEQVVTEKLTSACQDLPITPEELRQWIHEDLDDLRHGRLTDNGLRMTAWNFCLTKKRLAHGSPI